MKKPPQKTTAIVVCGAGGRMGRQIARAAAAESAADIRIAAAVERAGSPFLGLDFGALAGAPECGAPITTLARARPARADAFIDFSLATAAAQNVKWCLARGCALVVGATAHDERARRLFARASEKIAVVVAPNTSVGVNALFELAESATRLLRAGAGGGGYDIEVFEMHHREKRDSPSGTALRLGEALAAASGGDFARKAVFARPRAAAKKRRADEIGFSVMRGGDAVGEHAAVFVGAGEVLEIRHRATDRANYAQGALRAARFAAAAAPGLYDMAHVLRATR